MIRDFLRLLRDDSGQALFEAVFFMPVVIFGIAAVIFFSQLGVLSERSELAVRYGNDVSYKNGNQLYSVASVYALLDEVQNPGSSELPGLCIQNPSASPTSSAADSKIQSDIKAALVDAENPGNVAGPIASAKPYWKPVAGSVSVPGCQPGTVRLQPANSTGESGETTSNGGLPLSTAGLSVSSSILAPVGLTALMPNLETSAHETFLNVAPPDALIACGPLSTTEVDALAPGTTIAQANSLSSFCPGPPPSN